MYEPSHVEKLLRGNPALHVRPELRITHGQPASDLYLSEFVEIQKLWVKLQHAFETQPLDEEGRKQTDLRQDYSENGVILLAGRYLLPGKGQPVYWAVRDNRVHFSVRFDDLSAQDRMQLVNQVLVSYAQRSHKDDLKSAALAVTESGHFYVAMNTQEHDTMQWEKECAESNLTRLVKQLADANEKVAHMYVLGGLTDDEGRMRIADHLIGMCMRCVEIVKSIMGKDSLVTVIPANDGSASIGWQHTEHAKEVKPCTAWEVPYWSLKNPSIITFPDEVNVRQKEVFEAFREGVDPDKIVERFQGKLDRDKLEAEANRGLQTIPFLEANHTPAQVNAFMMADLARNMKREDEEITHASVAVVEINDKGKLRYAVGREIRGKDYNAMMSPVSVAIAQLSVPRPDAANRPYVQNIYVSGYNADGSPLDLNAEQWDRALKRAGYDRATEAKVHIIPMNSGMVYPKNDVQTHSLDHFSRTDFPGSKQHKGHGCC